VVGESGSGKSTLGLSLIGLVPFPGRIVRGDVFLGGKDVMKLKKNELRNLRGTGICYVFQDPMTSLNPVLTIGFQIQEPLRLHLDMNEKEAAERAAELQRRSDGEGYEYHPHLLRALEYPFRGKCECEEQKR